MHFESSYIVEIFPVGLFQCNCILIGDPKTKKALVIDPGDEVQKIMQRVTKHQLTIESVLHTHTHIDHIGATTALQKLTNAKVFLHREDLFLYEKMAMQADFLGIASDQVETPAEVSSFLTDGSEVSAGQLKGQAIHAPGHTPGSCGFFFPDLSQVGVLFAGDTLFAGSIGRTDLWKGDTHQEISSIKKKFFPLGDEVLVVPGHGSATTIEIERKENPFLI